MPGVNVPDGTDVTIIGGGIMGAATAYFLAAESDRDVLLLEKDQIASGSTGDSSAIIRHHYGDKEVYSKTARWSHEFYREFDAELGESIAYEPNPMVRYGGQGDEASQAFAMSGYDTLEAMDIPVSRLEREELEERYPMLDFDGIEFGVSDDDAAYSDGTDVAGGFARAAQNEGATVVTGVAVEDIVVEDGAVAAVETDAKTVATDDVVVTAGPWTPRLLSQVGVEVPIETTREQILILDPPEDFVSAYPDLVPSGGPPGEGWYMRPDFGEGVLVATHHRGETVDPDAYSDNPDQDAILRMVDDLDDFVPDLAAADIKGQYCGIYSSTPDHDFVIDQVGPDGCYTGCGFSGHGFKHGPAVGKLLRDLVVDGDTDLVDVEYFSLDRFEDNPEGYAGEVERI
ncbi:FAD-binding oxidoreductase [Haloarculaceae archaeon H-GB11]|nr:FAD-binding oxidoreductase [Haloarculaceae archaeon H-GB1-1]MEA5387884.1 FAD-binding oxidoreductase [Haloarculaceae archaeon H-GB11]